MKLFSAIFIAMIFPILFFLSNTIEAKGLEAKSDVFYEAPFRDVEVKGASKIYVIYSFNAATQTLSCYSAKPEDLITSVEWSYKDATRKIPLPVMLKDSANFRGYFADPSGKLVITNEFGPESLHVTCIYV